MSHQAAFFLLLVVALLCATPAMGGINILTNGPALSISTNWSLSSAPTANTNAGSHQDIVIEPLSTAMTNLYQTSGGTYSQSINVTNGLAYILTANSTNSVKGLPAIRLGDGTDSVSSGTSFSNSISGVTNDAIYLAGNSSLTILETNLNNATNSVLGNPLMLTIICTNGINFNVQTGSTLTINALITGDTANKKLALTGGGVFNYGGNP